MWGVSDEALLAGMASRDPQAAAAFVRRFQSRVYGLALTILADQGDAEEVAQEVFVRAWRHAEAYDPARGGVAPWLLTITRNVAVDMLRLRRAVPMDPSALLFLELPVTEAGPEERGLAAEEACRVRSAIAALPAEQRRALAFAAFFGRTAREISAIEDAPLGTIKTRIRTAMLKLHAQLEVNGP